MRTFDPDRFGVVTAGPNLLLRGNIPLTDQNGFAYEEIRTCVQATANVDLQNYHFMDVCLIDNVSERYMWTPEVTAFGVDPAKYPATYWPPWAQPKWLYGIPLGTGTVTTPGASHPGDLIWWPIEAPAVGEAPAQYLWAPGWYLDGLVNALCRWEKSKAPLALYVHCTLGADRTGAAIASYLVKTQKLTGEQAIAAVTQGTPAKVAPSPAYQRLISDYAAQPVTAGT